MPFFIWHNLPGSDESQIQAPVGAETQESLIFLLLLLLFRFLLKSSVVQHSIPPVRVCAGPRRGEITSSKPQSRR